MQLFKNKRAVRKFESARAEKGFLRSPHSTHLLSPHHVGHKLSPVINQSINQLKPSNWNFECDNDSMCKKITLDLLSWNLVLTQCKISQSIPLHAELANPRQALVGISACVHPPQKTSISQHGIRRGNVIHSHPSKLESTRTRTRRSKNTASSNWWPVGRSNRGQDWRTRFASIVEIPVTRVSHTDSLRRIATATLTVTDSSLRRAAPHTRKAQPASERRSMLLSMHFTSKLRR